MSTNLYDAHRQWASRPPDERFQSLDSLHSFVKGRKAASSEVGRVLNQIELKVSPEGAIAVNGNSPSAALSHWAFGQLCYSVGAPAKYLRTLPTEMARDCLSHGLGKSGQRCKLLLRANSVDSDTHSRRTASAFTAPDHRGIWNGGRQTGSTFAQASLYSRTVKHFLDQTDVILLVDPFGHNRMRGACGFLMRYVGPNVLNPSTCPQAEVAPLLT